MSNDHLVFLPSSLSEAIVELGESLNQFLTGLEDIGVDGMPVDMEIDLRHIMNIDSPSLMTSRLLDLEDDDLDDDLLEPFGLSPDDCSSHMAQLFQRDELKYEEPEDMLKLTEPFRLLPEKLKLNPHIEEESK